MPKLTPLAALLAVLLTVPATASGKELDRGTTAKLDRALRTTLSTTQAPGVIAGVWAGDRGWTATLGTSGGRTPRRPTLADHTRIGSVTKTMTGTLVLQLVDEGRLRLDDTIDRWFPGLAGADRITIRQLGEMSSGIQSYTRLESFTDRYFARPRTVWSPADLMAIGWKLPRLFEPGQSFDYSNTNFLMLGRIVERVTRKPLARVMRERLFAPLGMRHTAYPTTSRLPRPYWRGVTVQGSADGSMRDATNWSPTFAGAAGQVTSTLGDLRRWTRALGTGSLLRPATQRARLRPNPSSARGDMAYAFAVGKDSGWVLHSGELPGYNTQVAYLPARKLAVVVLVNADVPGADGRNPAPAIFTALRRVVAPGTVPAQ